MGPSTCATTSAPVGEMSRIRSPAEPGTGTMRGHLADHQPRRRDFVEVQPDAIGDDRSQFHLSVTSEFCIPEDLWVSFGRRVA